MAVWGGGAGHPLKTRLITSAQVKAARLDPRALSLLLCGGLIARMHIPPAAGLRLRFENRAASRGPVEEEPVTAGLTLVDDTVDDDRFAVGLQRGEQRCLEEP